ncbi:MAG TPA: hypothetical protein ENN19_17765 [Chloroflexi bacterium]|nr:hypothetical protein [Chloroflexota bacterium]
MAHFQLTQQPYIAAVRPAADDPFRLAIYAPGTLCTFWRDHRDATASFNYGFLILVPQWRSAPVWRLVGPHCLQNFCSTANPQPWISGLNQRHPLAGTGLPLDWRDHTRRRYWRLTPLMGMILQMEPNHRTLRSILGRMTQAKYTLSAAEKRTLLAILRERGGDVWARAEDQQAWSRELKAHFHVIKRRRDLAFRLARLAALDLSEQDRETVASLQAFQFKWRFQQVRRLSAAQEGLIGALEARYHEQRTDASHALAQSLAEQFALEGGNGGRVHPPGV